MTRQWLRSLARCNPPSRRHRRGPGQPFRPHLEDLEARQVPSTFTVTTTADSGPGSLRQALLDTQDGDTIAFDAALAGHTITLTSGELAITKSVAIEGPGADQLTISGNYASRVFDISGSPTVTIAGLTITQGRVQGDLNSFAEGGGIYMAGGQLVLMADSLVNNSTVGGDASPPATGRVGAFGYGGGIYSARGSLEILASTLTGNRAMGGGGASGTNGGNFRGGPGGRGGDADGGGILALDRLVVTDSTFSGNDAIGGPGGAGGQGHPPGFPGGTGLSLGGGICSAYTLTVTNSTFSGNGGTFTDGSGIATANGATVATVTSSSFSGNGGMEGGGIYNAGTLTVASSTFARNQVNDAGGGIYNKSGGTVTVVSSTFNSNSTGNGGGGIFSFGGSVTVTNSTFSDNMGQVGNGGGAISNFSGSLTLATSTLSGNQELYGGGISNYGGIVTLTNSTLSGNHASGDQAIGGNGGGGIYNTSYNNVGGSVTLMNSTLSGNTAVRDAGGIFVQDGTITLRNTIIAANNAPYSDVEGALDSQGHNLIGDGTGGSGFTATDLVGTPDAPIDPQLQPLGDYGGPTQTLRPLPSSPAVDAGDNTDDPPTDQRGFRRIVHGTIDIGAVELQRGERHGRHHIPSHQSGSSAEAAEVSRIIPPLVAGRPQVILEDSTLLPTLPAPRLGSDRGPGSADPLDAFFQLLGSNEQQGRSDWPALVARAGERASFLRLIPGIDHGEDFAALLV